MQAFQQIQDRIELKEAGFTDDEINADILRERHKLARAGFTDAEITQDTGYSTDNYLNIIGNANQRKLTTITPLQSSGFSPIINVGGHEGRFNFDIKPTISHLTPGLHYQFEGTDGKNWNYQIEQDYQGGNWQEAEHAEDNYNNYKNWNPYTRTEVLNQMWEGNPEVAEYIDNAVVNETPWEEVKEGLSQFDTYRQQSYADFKPAVSLSDAEIETMQKALIENKSLAIANMPEIAIGDEVDEQTRKQYDKINEWIRRYKIDPDLMNKNWSVPESARMGANGSFIGLVNNLIAMESGDPDAPRNIAEFFIATQAYGQQDFSKQVIFDVAAVFAELPIMIPAGYVGGLTCAKWTEKAGKGVQGAAAAGCSMGAAFGVPAVMRTALTDLMEAGIVNNDVEFLQVMAHALKEGGKEFLIGLVTGEVGALTRYASKVMGISEKTFLGRTATSTATLGTESAAMVTMGGWMHGHAPTWNDFGKTAAVLLVLRGGNKTFTSTKQGVEQQIRQTDWYIRRNLAKMYKEYNIDPRKVQEDMEANPELAQTLAHVLSQKEFVMPDYYFKIVSQIMKRIEQVSRSNVNVKGEEIKLSRFMDVKEGEATTLEVMGVNKKPGSPYTKITFEMKEDGNWIIKDFEGEINAQQIIAIADYAESKGRRIILDESFVEISKIIEQRESKVKPLDEIDMQIQKFMQEAEQGVGALRDIGLEELAAEAESTTYALIESAFGKNFVQTNKAKIDRYIKSQEDVQQQIKDHQHFIDTGFHYPDSVGKNQNLASPLDRIENLKIPKYDNEVGEVIATHITGRTDAEIISRDGFQSRNGFILFGSDNLADAISKQINNPNFIRSQIRFTSPLDLRKIAKDEGIEKGYRFSSDDFSMSISEGQNSFTGLSGKEGGVMMVEYFQQTLPRLAPNHPAIFTKAESKSVLDIADNQSQMLKISEILQKKGYDSIIFKAQKEGKVGDDAIFVLDKQNAKDIAFAEQTAAGKELAVIKKKVDKYAEEEVETKEEIRWKKVEVTFRNLFDESKVNPDIQYDYGSYSVVRLSTTSTAKNFAVIKDGKRFGSFFKTLKNAKMKVERDIEESSQLKSELHNVARQYETAQEFIESLHNRDYEAIGKDGTVDPLQVTKTTLARNFIEDQLSLFKDNPEMFRQALNEIGVVYSKKLNSFVKPPRDIDAYFKGKEKLEKVSEKDLEQLWEESQAKEEAEPSQPQWTNKTTPKGEASDTGYNKDLIHGSQQAKKIMNMPALVELVHLLRDGKLPSVLEKLSGGAAGMFRHRKGDKESGRIELMASIAKDPQEAAAILAHEIGHLADWLSGEKNYTMARGGILGRIGSLSNYLAHYLEGRPGGQKPLTAKEKNKLRREAKKIIESELDISVKDAEETGLTPQQVKDIFTGVLHKGEIDPAIWKFIQKADRKTKKEILRSAAKGKIYAEIKALERQDKESPSQNLKDKIKAKYEEMFYAEVERRELLSKDVVMDELKTLTKMWRPFDETADPKYTKYRYNTKELYADFLSAILTNPYFAKQTAPSAYKGFFNWLQKKPEFYKAYEKIQEDLSSGKTLDVASQRLREGFDKAEQHALEKVSVVKSAKEVGHGIMRDVYDKFWDLIKDVAPQKAKLKDSENPIYKVEEFQYQGSENEGFMTDMANSVIKTMEKNGIEINDIGEYLFHNRVVNEKGGRERGDIFNPRGFDRETSLQKIKELEKSMPKLPEIANQFWEVRKEWVVDRIEQTGMYDANLIKKIRDNRSYVTFDVVEYLDNNYGAGTSGKIFGQIGTLKDIANPFTRTLINDMMLMKATSRFLALDSVIRFYEAESKINSHMQFEPADKKFNGKHWEFKEPKDENLGLIEIIRNGKMEGYYLDKHIVKSFKESPTDGEAIVTFMRAMNTPFRKIFTELNYGFWMFNVWRDYKRAVRNIPSSGPLVKTIPYLKFVQYFGSWVQGISPAFKSVYGIPSAIAKEMYKNNELISIENRWGDNKFDREHERMMKRWHQIPHKWDNNVTKPVQWLWRQWHNIGQGLERVNKMAGHIYLTKHHPNMTPEERGHIIRNQIGSPAFLRQGRWTPATNNMFMFSNAMKEGWRGDIEVMRERPVEFFYNVFQYNIVPKFIMLGMAQGYFGEENLTIMNAVSEYDKANYIIIPLGLTEKGKAVYMRIPQDETGRFFSGVGWKAMNQTFGDKEANMSDFLAYGGGQIPSMSPYYSLVKKFGQYNVEQNPYDDFRNAPAINKTKWEAGGDYRRNAFLGHVWDSSGGKIVMSARGRFSDDIKEIESDMMSYLQDTSFENLEGFLKVPGIENLVGRFVKVSDQGVREYLDPENSRHKSAEQSLLTMQFLQKYMKDKNYEGTQEELEAVAAKEKGLGIRIKKLMVNDNYNAFMQEFINAPSEAARIEILKKIQKAADEGNISAKEILQNTNR